MYAQWENRLMGIHMSLVLPLPKLVKMQVGGWEWARRGGGKMVLGPVREG